MRPYEIIESVDINFPGLMHESFLLKIYGAKFLCPGVVLGLEDDPTKFVVVQTVVADDEVSLKFLTDDRHMYIVPEYLARGKGLRPMFHVLPPALGPQSFPG